MIVDVNAPVTLVGGADVAEETLKRVLSLAPHVVAADGGADAALAHGRMPEAVIGDLDSLSDTARAAIPEDRVHLISEQETTDFDKCLRSISAPLVLGVGFSGDRLDHQLAAYNSLVRHPHQRCILVGREELVFVGPPALDLDLDPDAPVSLFPMGAVEGLSDGLEWPINGLNFSPDGRVGTSNRAVGRVHLSLTAPKMLVILQVRALEIATRALLARPSTWPAP